MKNVAATLFLIVLIKHSLFAQFSVYDASDKHAQGIWDSIYTNEKNSGYSTLLQDENPNNRAMGYLILALGDSNQDSVIAHVAESVLLMRDYLGTGYFNIPDSVCERLSSNLEGGKGHLFDGLMRLYYIAPWQSEGFLIEKAKICREDNSLPFLAFTFLNRALLYSDVIEKPELALPLIDSAIFIWITIGDSLQLANNIKARGLVLLSMNRYLDAEKEMKLALDMFRQHDAEYGVVSCQLDLVKLYAVSGNSDSLIKYDGLCRSYLEKNDPMRLFALNTNRIMAYKISTEKEIDAFIDQNLQSLIENDFHPIMQIEFYKKSIEALSFFGDLSKEQKMNEEYWKLKSGLLLQGYYSSLF